LDGFCALKYDTPACCYVHPRGDYDYYYQYRNGDHTNENYHGEREDAYDTTGHDDHYRTGDGYARGKPYADASEVVEISWVQGAQGVVLLGQVMPTCQQRHAMLVLVWISYSVWVLYVRRAMTHSMCSSGLLEYVRL
jgi:hypothetical protein